MTLTVIKLLSISMILVPIFQMIRGMEMDMETLLLKQYEGKVENDLGDHQDDDIVLKGFYEVDALLKAVKDKNKVIESGVHIKRSFKKKNEEKMNEQNKENLLERGANDIRVMQWNVCSQAIGEHIDIFSKVTADAFSWPHRRYHMLMEFVTYMPDIITIQEVDHFKFLATTLQTQNYEGHFFPKQWSMAIWQRGNNGRDGIAIFYRTDRFQLQERKNVNLPDKSRNENPPDSNQAVSLVHLFDTVNKKEICVVTTHLKASRGQADSEAIRLMQGEVLKEFIHAECGQRSKIITGDFNDKPTGEVYKLFSSGVLELSSAYKTVFGEEPSYTTWKYRKHTGEEKETLDYIFYTSANFSVSKVLAFPDDAAIGEDLLPCLGYPSDHMSLVADLTFM